MFYDVNVDQILALSGRTNEWHFDLLNKNEQLKIRDIKCVESCSITYNSLTTLKSSLSIQMHDDSNINFLSDLLKVRLVIKVRNREYEFPMGVYKFAMAPADRDGSIVSIVGDKRSVTLYSKIKTYENDRILTDLELAAGTNIRSEIIRQLNTINYRLPTSTRTLQEPMIFKLGTTKIEIINTLLSSINCHSLAVDGNGVFYSDYSVAPVDRDIEIEYTDERNQMTLIPFNDDPGMQDIYNIFTGYATINDQCVNYSYINNNPDSPTSTVNIGNVCAEPREFSECNSPQDLQQKVINWANENSMKYHKYTFTTLINPMHGYLNCILFKNAKANMKGIETSWSIDSSNNTMSHTIREAVAI